MTASRLHPPNSPLFTSASAPDFGVLFFKRSPSCHTETGRTWGIAGFWEICGRPGLVVPLAQKPTSCRCSATPSTGGWGRSSARCRWPPSAPQTLSRAGRGGLGGQGERGGGASCCLFLGSRNKRLLFLYMTSSNKVKIQLEASDYGWLVLGLMQALLVLRASAIFCVSP